MYLKIVPTLTVATLLMTACGSGGGSSSDENNNEVNVEENTNEPESDSEESSDGNNEGESNEPSTPDTGDEDTDGNGGVMFRIGLINATRTINLPTDTTEQLNIGASFSEGESNFTESEFLDFFMQSASLTCNVILPDTPLDPEIDSPFDQQAGGMFVSAGEAIPITSDAGTYTTLVQTELVGIYLPDAPLSSPLPNGLVADIPGDVFPGFSNVVIPDVAELRVSSPTANQNISNSTPVTWDANGNGDSFITISATYSSGAFVTCLTEDDGSFSYPSDTIAELESGSNSAPDQFFINRIAFRIDINGTDILQIFNNYTVSFLNTDLDTE